MLENLMKPGGHRVDYLNRHVHGSPAALAFYVRGDLSGWTRFGARGKRHLYAGLNLIRELLGQENLAAVYLDVDNCCNQPRPAYQQMKADLRSGIFHRIFVFDLQDLVGEAGSEWAVCEDLRCLAAEVGDIDVISAQNGKLVYTSIAELAHGLPVHCWWEDVERVCQC